MTDRVVVTRGQYLTSAVQKSQYPTEERPEIVFIGRSNVGKSSLINSLTRTHNLARTSTQPGKTQTINFYEVGLKIEGADNRHDFYLVDLPGYGYAKVGRKQRQLWQKFIQEYLLFSPNICFICQLVDARHPPMESDIEMFHWLVENDLPVLLIATKTDKVKKTALAKNIQQIQTALQIEETNILAYSSHKNEGRSELLDAIASALIK